MGLRSLVWSGEFEASTRLPEVSLAQRLGISRTPLRQAMGQLVDEGLLERIDTGGCRVVSFTMDNIIDAIEVRGAIEGTAARLAAERGMVAELAEECRQILDVLDGAVCDPSNIDFDTYVPYNARFHALLGRLAGSAVVEREVERACRLPLASPSAFLQGQELIPDFRVSLRLGQDQHRSLFNAIQDREGSRAEALAREHARLARRNLKYVISERPNLASRVPGLALVAAT